MSESKVFPAVAANLAGDLLSLNQEVEQAVSVATLVSLDKWGKVVEESAAADLAIEAAFQRVLDTAVKVGVGRSESATKALSALIVNHPGFSGKVDTTDTESAQRWKYAQRRWSGALMRAWFHGRVFSFALLRDKDAALPWEQKKKKEKETKSIADLIRDGAPTIGKAADLHVLLAYTIKSCRATGLPDLAAELLDCVRDNIPTFAE